MPNNGSPARRVKPNCKSATGYYNSLKSGNLEFESQLERDAYLILDFEPNVKSVQVQPMRIENYVPDCLIETLGQQSSQLLAEIKYESELLEKWDQLVSKYERANEYCKNNNMKFGFVTDFTVYNRRNRLDVLKLIKYLGTEKDIAKIQERLASLVSKGGNSIRYLADELDESDDTLKISQICSFVCSGRAYVKHTTTSDIMDCILATYDGTPQGDAQSISDFFITFERIVKRLETHPYPSLKKGGAQRVI